MFVLVFCTIIDIQDRLDRYPPTPGFVLGYSRYKKLNPILCTHGSPIYLYEEPYKILSRANSRAS